MNTETAVKTRLKRKTELQKLVQISMLSAIAVVLMLFEIPIPFIAPPFYEIDFSEVPVLIGAFAMGPLAGAAIEFLKILLNLLINGTDTAFVGEIANFLMGCAFAVPAGWLYKRRKTRKNAVLGMLTGGIFMTIVGCFLNAYVLLPTYAAAFGLPLEQLVAMGGAINSAITNINTFVIFAVGPFNLLKAVLVSAITLLLYKHISALLKNTVI